MNLDEMTALAHKRMEEWEKSKDVEDGYLSHFRIVYLVAPDAGIACNEHGLVWDMVYPARLGPAMRAIEKHYEEHHAC